MGLGRLANLENTHILSLFSHINFHLVLIYWRSRFLFLRISNAEEKEQKLFCLYLWLCVSLSLSIQTCIGFEEGGMTPPCRFVKGGNPSWVPAVGESWGYTTYSYVSLPRTHGYKVTQESSCQGSPGATLKWQRRFFSKKTAAIVARGDQIVFFLSFRTY